MTDETTRIFDALDALLERERLALLQGRLELLSDILAEKEGLIDRLTERPLGGDELTTLRGKAERNQELMDNTLRGIRSVASRLGTLRRLRRSLETYDQAGRRKTIVTQGGSQVEKRA
ncbi:hypothetical protein [Pseudooceanicola nanhaiensis]|uniref:hypothetical protein n=1 Tax=Pseudooceanicola nanhaiensis TaxID=375761 RepID=UPI004058E41C